MNSKEFYMSEDDITSNQNFMKWFSGSKVVDAQGNPLVVYHGTNDNIDSFDKNKSNVFWFSSDKENIKSGNSGAVGTSNLIPVYLSIKKLAGWDEYENLNTDQIIQMGFDGIKLDNDYIVFEPNQIKSAVSNNGEFNPSSDNINESGGVTVYHGGDINNLRSLLKKFTILSPDEKLKLPSTGGGHIGLSTSFNKNKARRYSSVFGNDKILKIVADSTLKIYKIDTDGQGIDSFMYDDDGNLKSELLGYDALMELDNGAEEELRILNPAKFFPTAIIK